MARGTEKATWLENRSNEQLAELWTHIVADNALRAHALRLLASMRVQPGELISEISRRFWLAVPPLGGTFNRTVKVQVKEGGK